MGVCEGRWLWRSNCGPVLMPKNLATNAWSSTSTGSDCRSPTGPVLTENRACFDQLPSAFQAANQSWPEMAA